MADTSGVILPSFYSSEAELKAELKRRDEEAGYTPFNPEDFAHSSTEDWAKDFIEHHGVKGQKWGIRNLKNRVTTRKKTSSDYKKTAPYRDRRPTELSNKQLKDVTSRINMEQQYRRLHPTTMQHGARIAKSIIGALTTAASLYALSQSPAGKAAINAGESFLKKKIVK